MADKTWKAFERRNAKRCGTERIPVTGERDGADWETPMFCYQGKKREGQFPKTVASWLDSICTAASQRSPEKIGVVVIQRPGGKDLDALVVLKFSDWLDLHGPSEAAE